MKGITTIENVALINLEGAGMIGVPGTAHRLFGALREEGVNVTLISQGSSEHSIFCAIPQDQAERVLTSAKAILQKETAAMKQMQDGSVDRSWVDKALKEKGYRF